MNGLEQRKQDTSSPRSEGTVGKFAVQWLGKPCHLLHHKKDANLIFQFDANHIDILSDSYVVDDAGVRTARIIPNDWIENLEQAIREFAAHMPQK